MELKNLDILFLYQWKQKHPHGLGLKRDVTYLFVWVCDVIVEKKQFVLLDEYKFTKWKLVKH